MITDYPRGCQVIVFPARKPTAGKDYWYNGGKGQAKSLKGELSALEQVTIQRRASYLYARAYFKLVVALTLVYAAVGAGLGIISELTIDSVLAGIMIITLGV